MKIQDAFAPKVKIQGANVSALMPMGEFLETVLALRGEEVALPSAGCRATLALWWPAPQWFGSGRGKGGLPR